MNDNYEDLIDYDYRGSQTRQHMSMNDRAAQFAPFSALEGYEDAVEEKKNENLEKYSALNPDDDHTEDSSQHNPLS